MIVVLDSNCFKDDARAVRPKLQTVLEAAGKGAFELVVPEVVIDELDKQFARRTKKAYKEIRTAINSQADEFAELGLSALKAPARDIDDVNGYRTELESRLQEAGARLTPHPADLRPAIPWAVHRRKPFDASGKGMPDAVLWITALELASKHDDEIALVSADKDFAESKSDPRLASVLADDLSERGISHDQVRRIPGLGAFVEELGERREASRDQAEKLIENHAFDAAIESRLMFSQLPQGPLELGVELDDDPTVLSWDLENLRLEDAVSLPGGALYLEAVAEVHLLLNLIIYRADYHFALEADEVHFAVTDSDFNRHYVEAESELDVELDLVITASEDGSDAQVDLIDVSLTPYEQASRDLGRRRKELIEQLRQKLAGISVGEFTPEEPIDSDIEEVTVEESYSESVPRMIEVLESDQHSLSAQLAIDSEADVCWVVSAPTPFDADHFASLALNESSGAPILQNVESRVPLVIDLVAKWEPDQGWYDLRLNSVSLDPAEAKRRSGQLSAAEQFEVDRMLEDQEE